MKLYGVIVSTSRVTDGWESVTHSPTLWLDPNVQGITSAEGAARIAEHMAREIAGPGVKVWVTAWSNCASETPVTVGDDPMKELRRG